MAGLSDVVFTVRIDGHVVEVEDVDLGQEIATETGSPIAGGNGIAEGEARIRWALPRGLTGKSEHPWLPSWIKNPGRPVTVDIDTGQGLWRAYTGTTLRSDVRFSDGVVTTRCVDSLRELNRPITIPAVSHLLMPPAVKGGQFLLPTLYSTWHTNEILSQCGLWATAPRIDGCVMHASMFGSLWPSVGTLTRAHRKDDSQARAGSRGIAWGGVGMVNPDASYDTEPVAATSRKWVMTIDLDLDWRDFHDMTAIVTFPSGDAFGLVMANGALRVHTRSGGVPEGSLPAIPRGEIARVMLVADNNGVHLWTDAGDVHIVSRPLDSRYATGTVRVQGVGTIGSVQVTRPEVYSEQTRIDQLVAPRRARVRRDAFANSWLAATPPVINEEGLGLLIEQSQCDDLAMWVSDEGLLEVCTPGILESAQAVHVITDLPGPLLPGQIHGDIPLDDLTASVSSLGPYSKVQVESRVASVQVRRTPTLLLYAGQRQTLESGDQVTEFVEPGPDTDWLGPVDTSIRYAGSDTGGDQAYNRRRGNWAGGHLLDTTTGEPVGWITAPQFMVAVTQINARTLLIEGSLSILPPGVEMSTLPAPDSVGLWPSRAQDPLPEIRGMGILTWANEVTESDRFGPAGAPPFVIRTSWWVQHPTRRAQLADIWARHLMGQHPILEGVECAIAPVRLGDRVTIRVTTVADLTIDVVVIGRRIGIDSMSLTVRVLAVENHALTYGQDLDAYGHLTYAQDTEAA